ncbi:MAG: NUDIX pyrophosphatase [Chloroflexi bacterium]|nr:NUDIX pyrophosphatase [Chloroflexota bacterium]
MSENKMRTSGWPAHRVTGVDVWPFRGVGGAAEFLLLHRSGRDGPPFWQGVSGWIEADEPPHLAALRELREETGLAAVELYSVNSVFDLYAWRRGTVETIVPFAARVADGADPVLSDEHDDWRWARLGEALALLPYEPQREALRRVFADLLERPGAEALYRIEIPPGRPEKTR